ncbi:hypothetical protein C6P40_003787 [Pichia californica]|uniref:Uncharacterized protein n=1 Tax=Pichia californica TaxID=460514 RepID=A0A9P6WI76_9ASCO|nr:hypothetical protein C6P40_003787 [[Candida] californica]
MRSTLRVFQYVQSIKFVGGPHPIVHTPATVHACAPNGLKPSIGSTSAATSLPTVPFQSRNNLSKRFQYTPIDDIEIDDVLTGGADVFIK